MSATEDEKTLPPATFTWCLADILSGLQQPAISQSTQGLVHKYVHEAEEYVVKIRGQVPKSELIREIRFTQRAGDLGVGVVGYIYGRYAGIIGFTMPCLRVIEPATMTHVDKMDIFHQIRQIIPQLHKRQIVHGDIKLSNMLLDGRTLKLCDFGTSAWMEETKFPAAISVRWCSPYRLDRITRRPLIANEDIYASGLAVWELFVGEIPFADIDSDDEEADLEGKIRSGLIVNVSRINVEEVELYVEECLKVFS
jgi:hypothetical protein